MVRDRLSTLSAFLAVAEERSFTQAAKRLRVTPSAMSHAIRGLEEGLGVRLLSRTTRSVSLTYAGEQLIARLRPPISNIQEPWSRFPGSATSLPVSCDCWCRGLRGRLCSCRNWDSFYAITRTLCSTSPLTIAALTLLPEASTQAFITGDSFKRT